MLFVVGIILVVLWLVGFLTTYTFGGFIYVALIIGTIMVMSGSFRRSHVHHRTTRFAPGVRYHSHVGRE